MTTLQLGHLTSAVQLGFIVGSLTIALSGIADRISASRIFTTTAIFGAVMNANFVLCDGNFSIALLTRFAIGLALAGIYPIGMKLIVSWVPERAGNALGWMVGLSLVGTGLPHLIRGSGLTPHWQFVLYASSFFAILGGLLIRRLGDGPHHATTSRTQSGSAVSVFAIAEYRAAALGYFGHMWELFAFFALLPFLIAASGVFSSNAVYLGAFATFFLSGLGCVIGGLLSRKISGARIAIAALAGSCVMCLVVPFIFEMSAATVMLALFLWGMFASADSPQFSALAANACPAERVGGALALMNSIGFAITIISIEIVTALWDVMQFRVVWLLLPGPLFGLFAMRRLWHAK